MSLSSIKKILVLIIFLFVLFLLTPKKNVYAQNTQCGPTCGTCTPPSCTAPYVSKGVTCSYNAADNCNGSPDGSDKICTRTCGFNESPTPGPSATFAVVPTIAGCENTSCDAGKCCRIINGKPSCESCGPGQVECANRYSQGACTDQFCTWSTGLSNCYNPGDPNNNGFCFTGTGGGDCRQCYRAGSIDGPAACGQLEGCSEACFHNYPEPCGCSGRNGPCDWLPNNPQVQGHCVDCGNITCGACVGSCGIGTTTCSNSCGYSYTQDCDTGRLCAPPPTATPVLSSTPTPTSTATPTPTTTNAPTPTPGPWYKLNGASFNKAGGNLSNRLPQTINKYDSVPPSDTTDPWLIVGAGGVTTYTSIDLGTNVNVKTSQYNWKPTTSYPFSPPFFINQYKDYVKARKQFKTITSLSNSTITSPGIYLIKGSQSITDATILNSSLNNAPFVLIVDGNVTIVPCSAPCSNKFNYNPPIADKLVAILSTGTLNIPGAISEIHGVFAANSVNLNSDNIAAPHELKIVGNLLLQTDMVQYDLTKNPYPPFNRRAHTTDPSFTYPTIYLVFDPQYYVALLPYLSTATYDWKQLQ